MSNLIDWKKIFVQCKENVRTHTGPLLTMKGPQPELGLGAGGDEMKLVDLAAEKAIIETFLSNDLSFTLVSEESGIKEFGNSPEDLFVTVDPIDGTTNLIRGLPFFCTSIAISKKPSLSSVFAASVIDLKHGCVYTALEGRGAVRDDAKISTSTTKTLEQAVIGLDLNTYQLRPVTAQVSNLIQETKHIRHFGANALEICYVADGSTDAFVDIRGKLRVTDVAAAFFILKQAGGVLSTIDGKPLNAKLDPTETLSFVASGNTEIHDKILNLIRK